MAFELKKRNFDEMIQRSIAKHKDNLELVGELIALQIAVTMAIENVFPLDDDEEDRVHRKMMFKELGLEEIKYEKDDEFSDMLK